MNKIVSLSIVAILANSAMTPAAVSSDSSLYAGGGYSQIDIDGIDSDPGTILGMLGWQFNQNFSAEARLGVGIKDGSVQFSEFDSDRADVELSNYVGGFIRGTFNAADNLNLYGLLGYGRGKIKLSFDGDSESDSDSSEAYGVGAEFVFGNQKEHHVAFEWLKTYESGDLDVEGVSLLYRYRF